jgi:peptide/nickel transport system permease protein
MLKLIARRLLLMLPIVLGVSAIAFLLVRLIPGDPARVILGIHATPELIEATRTKLGLDQSMFVQYLIFLRHLVVGDLGHSYYYGEAVGTLVAKRSGPTIMLLAFAAFFASLIALPCAIMAALRQGSVWDHAVRVISVIGLGIPGYWLGIVLILAFSIELGLFPVAGFGDAPLEHLHAIILPSVTIALGLVPLALRALRGSMIEMLNADHVDTARAKGLLESRVIARHVLRNSLMPAVTVLSLNIGYLVGGTVLIENVFAIPGLGQLLISAVGTRDYPTIQAVTLVFALLVVAVNLLTDLLYLVLDPRLRGSMQ